MGNDAFSGGSDISKAIVPGNILTNVAGCLNQAARTGSSQVPPVRVEGCITLVDRERNLIILQDASRAMGVYLPLSQWALSSVQWVKIEGNNILPYVRAFPKYPDQPSEQSVMPAFETPSGLGTYYLNRIRGYLSPPVSGEYTFWITADDAGEFWISPDADPERMRKFLEIKPGSATGPREWERYGPQRSKPLKLEAGRSYYVEALHVQSYGRDNFAIAWQGPGFERSVIAGNYLKPWMPDVARATNGLLREFWTNYFIRGFDALRLQNTNESVVRISSPRLTVMGVDRLPGPRQVELTTHLDTVPNFEWVEMEGEVSFATQWKDQLRLELNRAGAVLGVHLLRWNGKSVESFKQARIRVRGVLEHTYDTDGELLNNVLWVPNEECVTLLEERGDERELSRSAICEIESSNPAMGWGRKVTVRGRIVDQSTNGLLVLQGEDNYMGFCSTDGTNWTSLGPAVEIPMSNSISAGLAVVSRHNQISSTAKFLQPAGWGVNWDGTAIGNPLTIGTFNSDGATVAVTGSGRKLGDRSDQFYFVHQPWCNEGEIVTRLADVRYENPLTQIGLMARESSDARAPFAAVLLTPARGPAFQYRRNLGQAITGYKSELKYVQSHWLKLVRRKSLLLVQGQSAAKLPMNQELDVTGMLTWQKETPILMDTVFSAALSEDHGRQPVTNEAPQSIAAFVAKALHPPEPFLLGRLTSSSLYGVVIFCGEVLGKNMMFIQSGAEGGIRVEYSDTNAIPRFEAGQLVEVQGLADVRVFPVRLQPQDLKQVGWGTLPRPEPYSSSLIKEGAGQAKWVECSGVVRSCATNGLLMVKTGEGMLTVWIGHSDTGAREKYVDASLRLRGVLSLDSKFNAQLLVPSPEFVEVQEASPTDPFAIPSFAIADLAALNAKPERLRRMKTSGVITCSLPQGIFIQDETGGGFVPSATFGERHLFRPGDRVEVVGFPEKETATLILKEAVIRKTGAGQTPSALPVSKERLGTESTASLLVTVDALLIGQNKDWSGDILTLQAGTKIFEAVLESADDNTLLHIPVGSRLRITGVCQVGAQMPPANRTSVDLIQSPTAVKLWLRTPADLVILARPPWWTLARFAWVGGLAAFGLLSALAWVRVLRNRVIQRTRELKETMQQLEKETRASTMLAERDRLAGEIHDSLQQGLAAIILQLDAANRQAGIAPEAQRILRMARSMAEFSRAEVEHAVWDLQSPLLDNADLGTALTHIAHLISPGTPRVTVEILGPPHALPSSHEHHLLRIAQEAITNAIKHAEARSIRVTLDYSEPDPKLTIEDDGKGFVLNEVKSPGQSGHFGLQGIRARVKKIEAQLEISSQMGAGTVVVVRMTGSERPKAVSEEDPSSSVPTKNLH